jgi:hypothetical protein
MRDTVTPPISSGEARWLNTDALRFSAPSDDIAMSSLLPPDQNPDSEHLHLLEPDRNQSAVNSNAITPRKSDDLGTSAADASRANKLWTWWKESALLLAASALLIAIISILAVYSGKPLPKWTFGLNLNTIVALLATSLRSNLVIVVEESQ